MSFFPRYPIHFHSFAFRRRIVPMQPYQTNHSPSFAIQKGRRRPPPGREIPWLETPNQVIGFEHMTSERVEPQIRVPRPNSDVAIPRPLPPEPSGRSPPNVPACEEPCLRWTCGRSAWCGPWLLDWVRGVGVGYSSGIDWVIYVSERPFFSIDTTNGTLCDTPF